jgi:hypothetical protein
MSRKSETTPPLLHAIKTRRETTLSLFNFTSLLLAEKLRLMLKVRGLKPLTYSSAEVIVAVDFVQALKRIGGV